MPKERRKRTAVHAPSVKVPPRQLATQDTAVDHIEIGSKSTVLDGQETLNSITEPEQVFLKKKEKQQLKRDLFLERLEATNSPYSKSHNRRVKRKAKEQLATGLDDIKVAIAALDDSAPATTDSMNTSAPKHHVKAKAGQIGEGNKATLSKAQRKRALELERFRHPLILSNPQFIADPFATIQTHAQNTLLKHTPAA